MLTPSTGFASYARLAPSRLATPTYVTPPALTPTASHSSVTPTAKFGGTLGDWVKGAANFLGGGGSDDGPDENGGFKTKEAAQAYFDGLPPEERAKQHLRVQQKGDVLRKDLGLDEGKGPYQ